VGREEQVIIQEVDVKTVVQFLKDAKEQEGRVHPVLKDLGVTVFWGARLWVAEVDGFIVHLNATKLGKRKKNKWEPYANWYIAYTLPAARRAGIALAVGRHVREVAVAAGCVRLKSLAGSFLGLRLHLAMGDECWGRTTTGEVVVDTPLVEGNWSGVPPNARQDVQMKNGELSAIKALRYD
jgi:GNAT superfamily N-acetyltransferase